MRILWLMAHNRNGDLRGIARRLHYDFIVRLKEKCDKFMIYGPNLMQSEHCPLDYDRSNSWTTINRKLKPDIVILYSLGNVKDWLPRDFKNASVIKVMIECDYWYVKSHERGWYRDWNINLMIHRGYYEDRKLRLPSVWLPFSANENDFCQFQSKKLEERMHFVTFVGRGGTDITKVTTFYYNRRHIVHELSLEGLIKCKGRVGHANYPKELSNFFCALTDTGRDDSPPGKVFEIMAAGTLLLTTPFNGKEALFGDREVCLFYKKNRKDVVDVVKDLLKSGLKGPQAIVDNAVDEINKKHLHKHRIDELYSILTSYYNTGTVEKKWGI